MRVRCEALKVPFQQGRAGQAHALMVNIINGWNCIAGRLRAMFVDPADDEGRPGGRLRDRRTVNARGRSGEFRPAASKASCVCRLPHAWPRWPDAEDMVQEAFIRWMKADRSRRCADPRRSCAARSRGCCLDQLKSAQTPARDLCRPVAPRSCPSKRTKRRTSPCR